MAYEGRSQDPAEEPVEEKKYYLGLFGKSDKPERSPPRSSEYEDFWEFHEESKESWEDYFKRDGVHGKYFRKAWRSDSKPFYGEHHPIDSPEVTEFEEIPGEWLSIIGREELKQKFGPGKEYAPFTELLNRPIEEVKEDIETLMPRSLEEYEKGFELLEDSHYLSGVVSVIVYTSDPDRAYAQLEGVLREQYGFPESF